MAMKTRDIVIGLLVLIVVVGLIFLRQRNLARDENLIVPQTLSSEQATEQLLEAKLNLQIPENVEKAELEDAIGGNSSGIATHNFADGKFTFSIIADLPDPAKGSFYEGWIVKGEEGTDSYALISLGRLKSVKGGWTLSYQSTLDYSDYSRVIVSSEKKVDRLPETHVLEGSF
jgi:hypothetical protein